MKEHSARLFSSVGPLRFEWTNPQHAQAAQVFLFLLSAFIGAFGCVTYYIETACGKNESAKRWFKAARKNAVRDHSVLAAFAYLRNSDVHERHVAAGASTWHTVSMAEKTTSSEFRLSEQELRMIEKLQEQPWAINLLKARPIVALAEDALKELRTVIDEGVRLGHLP
jgi:hypothetical protein